MRSLARPQFPLHTEMKKWFFDRPRVINAVDKATRSVLSRFGLYVKREAKKLIKPPGRMRLREMTPEERATYKRRLGMYKAGKLRHRPQKPRRRESSRPGQPPRSQTGILKRFIYDAMDPRTRSVVIGPARIERGTDAPRVLEYGGRTRLPNGRTIYLSPRPYMRPALAAKLPQLPKLWKDAVQ